MIFERVMPMLKNVYLLFMFSVEIWRLLKEQKTRVKEKCCDVDLWPVWFCLTFQNPFLALRYEECTKEKKTCFTFVNAVSQMYKQTTHVNLIAMSTFSSFDFLEALEGVERWLIQSSFKLILICQCTYGLRFITAFLSKLLLKKNI